MNQRGSFAIFSLIAFLIFGSIGLGFIVGKATDPNDVSPGEIRSSASEHSIFSNRPRQVQCDHSLRWYTIQLRCN